MEIAERVSSRDLRGADIFAGLPDTSLEKIAMFSKQRVYEAGEYCVVQGEIADKLLIVNEGKIASEIRIQVAPHTHTVTIATLTKGNVAAWSALVPPHVLTGSVKCVERSRVISIMASDLQHTFEEDPLIECIAMRNLTRIIGARLRDSHTQLVRLIVEVIKQAK